MKIGIAQINPVKGNIERNIESHLKLIQLASVNGAEAIFFPELSITGYEPTLAELLKVSLSDERLQVFRDISHREKIVIGLGAPTKTENGVGISMLIFSPRNEVLTYTKQMLHEDELPYFKAGTSQVLLNIGDLKIVPAICYESLRIEHLENAIREGANIYIASVAKSQKGINEAQKYFPSVAKEKQIPILMANCVGPCDNFESVGQSTVWNKNGQVLGQLDHSAEGILIYDAGLESISKVSLDCRFDKSLASR